MKRFDTDIAGFTVHEIRKENFQRDLLEFGQGFAMEVHKKDGGPAKPDTFVATTRDGRYTAEGSDEADAAQALRIKMQEMTVKGEL